MRKLGINYYSGFGLTCEQWLETVKCVGFDAVFSGPSVKSGDKILSIGEFSELCAKSGLEYDCVHAPFDKINDIWSNDSEIGDAMLARITDCVEKCGQSGVPAVVVHLSSGQNPPVDYNAGRVRLDKLVDCAAKNGVVIAFENQRKLANISYVFELYENVKNVGFCWDVGHEKCFADGREFMPIFGDKLVYTHIHDNYCNPDGDLHMIPFDGSIDYARTAELLKKYYYNGTLTLEVFPQPGKQECALYEKMNVNEYYTRAYSAATRLRDMVES